VIIIRGSAKSKKSNIRPGGYLTKERLPFRDFSPPVCLDRMAPNVIQYSLISERYMKNVLSGDEDSFV
jgi:hypothetical protein